MRQLQLSVLGLLVLGTILLQSEARRRPFYRRILRLSCSTEPPRDLAESFSDPIPESRQIVGECFADVNRCQSGTCFLRNDEFRFSFFWTLVIWTCPRYGIIIPVTESTAVDCGAFGSRDVEIITECSCGEDEPIEVRVSVVNSEDGSLLPGMTVLAGGFPAEETAVDGEFIATISSRSTFVVVSAEDSSGNFIANTKRVDIQLGFRGPIEVTVSLLETSLPVSIDSETERELSISDNPENTTAGVATITISPNSFQNQDGSPYNGTVLVSINVIDISDSGVETTVPGQFITIDNEELISNGIFAVTFKDQDGNLLDLVDFVTVTVPDDMRLWNLGSSGFWEPVVEQTRRRRKRSISQAEFIVNVENARWVNIDRISGDPICYFKARVFESDGITEIETSGIAAFQPQVLGFITSVSPAQRLRIYTQSTQSPADTCFAVRCPVDTELAGFINMTAYESALVGGISVPIITHLTPRELSDYSDIIETSLNAVEYEKAFNDLDIFVNFISNETGPFYTNRAICENSLVTDAAFHFIKPSLPSYEPVPVGTQFCTARVGFDIDEQSIDTLDTLDTSPIVTAVSTWTENGTDFFFTDTVSFDQSKNVTNNIFSLCITYRCSENDSSTTVYLLVTSPNITVPAESYAYANESSGAQDSNDTITIPALMCSGLCAGPLCYGDAPENLSGSFTAPVNVDFGPDFYDGISNNCTEELMPVQFATEISCIPYVQMGGDIKFIMPPS